MINAEIIKSLLTPMYLKYAPDYLFNLNNHIRRCINGNCHGVYFNDIGDVFMLKSVAMYDEFIKNEPNFIVFIFNEEIAKHRKKIIEELLNEN
jgi:hypothetical protein